jgi:hypothetical protein
MMSKFLKYDKTSDEFPYMYMNLLHLIPYKIPNICIIMFFFSSVH